MKKDENKTIKSVDIFNEDGTKDTLKKGMVISYEPKQGDEVSINLRFFNLKNDELAAILHGLSKLSE
jgi:hypothetical protein